jgi:hypothetical protein
MRPVEIEAATAPLLKEASKLEQKARDLRALAKESEKRLEEITGKELASPLTDLTLEALAAAIRKKNGRLNDFADRLRTTEEIIKNLLAGSNGQIYTDERGWLRIREDLKAVA